MFEVQVKIPACILRHNYIGIVSSTLMSQVGIDHTMALNYLPDICRFPRIDKDGAYMFVLCKINLCYYSYGICCMSCHIMLLLSYTTNTKM